MENAPKKVIFIGGTSFSGSTMLDMMLANTPYGFSTGEVKFLFCPLRPHHYDPACGCLDPECTIWQTLQKAGRYDFYQELFSRPERIDYIVDSSKNPWWIRNQSRYLESMGFKVFHFLIWKEPEAFAYSSMKRGRSNWRKAWVHYHRLYVSLVDRFTSVSYRQLAEHPARTLERLCRGSGLTPAPEQDHFWQKEHHTLFGNNLAKFHIHGNHALNQGQDRGEQSLERHHYQSIYYNTAFRRKLPLSTLRAIQKDRTVQDILRVLKRNQTPDKALKYSNQRLAAEKAKEGLKQIIGTTIGRYRRIL